MIEPSPSTSVKFDEDLAERFRKFTGESTNFSQEVVALLNSRYNFSPEDRVKANLFLARTVFSKWSIEILTVLYGLRSATFGELKKNVKGIAPPILSAKLRRLEEGNMIKRTLIGSRPPKALYTLTERGLVVAKLGEPVLLYTAITEGLIRELVLQR